MSEPFWTPLGGQPVDYEGTYDPAVQYAPGDVVVYRGVTYLAVNPSLGSVPPVSLSWQALGGGPGVGLPLDRAGLSSAPSALDDEFNVAGALAGKWSLVGTAQAAPAPAVADPTYAPEGLFLGRSDTSVAQLSAYLQALSGPATIYAKLARSWLDGTNCRRGGLVLTDAAKTTASPAVYLGSFCSSSGARACSGIRYSNFSTFSANYGALNLAPNSIPLWIKCQILAGMTSYSAWASEDGHSWWQIELNRAVGFTIANVGLGFSMEGQTTASWLVFDYFRAVMG